MVELTIITNKNGKVGSATCPSDMIVAVFVPGKFDIHFSGMK